MLRKSSKKLISRKNKAKKCLTSDLKNIPFPLSDNILDANPDVNIELHYHIFKNNNIKK